MWVSTNDTLLFADVRRQDILDFRPLHRYVQAILLIDRGSYESPKTYIERNRYFFTRQPPKPSSSLPVQITSSSIPDDDVASAVRHLLHSDETKRSLAFWDADADADENIAGLWQHISAASNECNKRINAICRERATETLTLSDSDEPVESSQVYKDWVRAMHAYLRQALAYGQPSPSTGFVMAVLGSRECGRRLALYDGAKKDHRTQGLEGSQWKVCM